MIEERIQQLEAQAKKKENSEENKIFYAFDFNLTMACSLKPSLYYEWKILKSLQDEEGNPIYDDLADYLNLTIALQNVAKMVLEEAIVSWIK